MIERILEKQILAKINKKKAIILMGPRQVGKTTLLKSLFEKSTEIIWLNGDEPDIQSIFENISSKRLEAIIGNKKMIIIDEAQRIPEIGLKMKLITDQLINVQLIATGSSAFELSNKLNEPLTGRKWEFKMYPISFQEMVNHHGLLNEIRLLPHRLIYGFYPDVVNHPGNEKEILKQLSDSYLYKDLLMIDQIKKPSALVKLLQALALQIGSQVSYHELAQICGLDGKTIEKYMMLLEQSYIIFRLTSFSRNQRNELKKSRKVYFFDNGIRNSLIANFEQIENRTDIGALWENYLVSERVKYLAYQQKWVNNWYWRTTEQQEIDYVEEENGQLSAYEFKWNPKAKGSIPNSFKKTYPTATINIIHRENFEQFLGVKG
ncbi:MAG: ATP-binding protein [Bacteroidota bacterium]|jgi:predicted AAA+ superfamily ATPase